MVTRGTGVQQDVTSAGDGEIYGGDLPNGDLHLASTRDADKGRVRIIQSDALSLEEAALVFALYESEAPTQFAGSTVYRTDALALAIYNNAFALPHYMPARIFDEFIYGSTAKMPWETVAIGTGTLVFIAGEINHPGILQFDGNDADAGFAIHRGLNSVLLSEDLMFCAVLVRFDSTAAAQHLSAGLGDSTTTTDDTDAIGFVVSAAATIKGRCRAAGVETLTTPGFTFSTGTWYWLVWSAVGASGIPEVRFWVLTADGALGADLGSVLTNIPTGAMGPNVRWRTTNATDKTMDLGCYILAVHDQVTPLRQS